MSKNKKQGEGRPVVWRHHMSGVWIGWLSESPIPGHLRLDGRRVRQWRGGRTDCSGLAVKGCTSADLITERVTTDIAIEGSVEISTTENAKVLEAMGL